MATSSLSSFRGASSAPLRNSRQRMSGRDLYGGSVPQFGRKSEVARSTPPSHFVSKVMNDPAGPWSGSAPPVPSNYGQTPDSTDSSGSTANFREDAEVTFLPMEPTEPLGTLEYLDVSGSTPPTAIEPSIAAAIHKNFFMGPKYYTCYRRNYMACVCSYSLDPYMPGMQIQFTPIGSAAPLQVYGFAMCISAIVSASAHQEVTILQHTPKRDKGPITNPQKQTLGPKAKGSPGHLAGFAEAAQSSQHGTRSMYTDIYGMSGAHQTLPTEHNFDRIQFKTATANNGERRAGQQCYRLVIELWADVGTQVGQNEPDRWVKVAIQKSPEIVVRGRSPGHYQKEKRRGSGGDGGGGPSPHSGSYSGGTPDLGANYGGGGMLNGQGPNPYANPAPYEPRNMYASGQVIRPDLSRRDVSFSLEAKAFESTRMFPSSFTNPSPYAGEPWNHQPAQNTLVSPMDVYIGAKRPSSDTDMTAAALLPRPAEPTTVRTGLSDGGRVATAGSSGSGHNSIYPLPSLATGSYISS